MKPLLKELIYKLFKTPGIWFATFLIVAYVPIIPQGYNDPLTHQVIVPIIFCLFGTSLTVAIMGSWGYSLANVKTSSILKRLRVSQYSKYDLILISLIPLLITIIYIISLSAITFAIFAGPAGIIKDVKLAEFQWGILVIFTLINILVSTGIAFAMLSILKTINSYQSFIWIYSIFIIIFGGGTVPLYIIINMDKGPKDVEQVAVFEYIAFILPNTYVNFALSRAVDDSFDISKLDDIIRIIVPTLVGAVGIGVGASFIRKW